METTHLGLGLNVARVGGGGPLWPGNQGFGSILRRTRSQRCMSRLGAAWKVSRDKKGAPDCGRLGRPRVSNTSVAGEHFLGELRSPWGRENHRT